MLRPILWATFLVATVFADGEFVVLHSPDTVVFNGKEKVDQSQLKEVFTAALGFTPKQGTDWKGVRTTGPFNLPEAVVVIAVEGLEHLHLRNGKVFPLNDDEAEETTWQALSGRLEERDNRNELVRLCVGDGLDHLGQSALGELRPSSINESTLKSLSLSNKEDRQILEEIGLLQAIEKNVHSAITSDGKPDVYWLVVSGMRSLIELHGNNSAAVNEALALLNNAISNVSEAFMASYNGKVLIAAFTNGIHEGKVRQTREANLARERREEAKATTAMNDEEESEERGEDADATTRTSEEGSSLKKLNENPEITESNEETKENSENSETGGARESSTVKSSLERDETARNNENSNTDTENTNKTVKIGKLKLSKRYSDNYPVVFNIFLWFGVVFFFSLLAICIVIADMDPGRDSVIYRMTSTRMKKDN